MAFDNTITVVGNVTRDPELRFTQGGMAVANFGVAWNKKKADGEEEVSFFNVSCFRQLAENVAESITKGSRVVVYGMLQQRSWDTPDGDRRSAVEIVADDVAPSLKWASAEIRRNEFRGEGGNAAGGNAAGGNAGGGSGGASRPASNEAPPAYDMDEEPF
ncbi:MAG: single-strand DNA-binding protein [Candidatus Aldehydirespiratoraceae bacterium]|jgi:single-strand DNA-binding protein